MPLPPPRLLDHCCSRDPLGFPGTWRDYQSGEIAPGQVSTHKGAGAHGGWTMTEERIELLFGKGHLPVTLPADVRPTVIRKGVMPKLSDPRAAISAAFANPICSAPLSELARGKNSTCILICDITRPVPNRLFL